MPEPFTVLLGPDHVGKSSLLGAIGSRFRVVGLDDDMVGHRHRLVPRLRRHLLGEVVPGLRQPSGAYSVDFAMSLMQAAVVHLRDQVREPDPAGRPTLVDSYYYKILAKCVLLGCGRPALDWWRTFPEPQLVLWLDLPPEEAWRRSGNGARVNLLEHYGDHCDQSSFEAYQRDLRAAMRAEIAGLPVVEVDPDDPAAVATMLEPA